MFRGTVNAMALSASFLEILMCPKRFCRGDLTPESDADGAPLRCVTCGDTYPVIDGIPVLFPNERYGHETHKRHWDQETHASSYAKKYDSYLRGGGSPWGLYTHISELNVIKKLLRPLDLTGRVLLDSGCGNGRLLSIYPQARIRIGVDTSLSLLKATKLREPSFWLICGQAEDMPMKDAVADVSVSIRVFQHLKAPEDAFREMVRTTKPSGYIVLEVYNKYNLKELYKRIRMLPIFDRIKPWGLSYDRYYSYREIATWCRESFVKPLAWGGAGWGFHFWLFDIIKFRAWAPRWLQKTAYHFSFALEDFLGMRPFFSKTMEKICVIARVRGTLAPRSLMRELADRVRARRSFSRAARFARVLEERGYSFVGTDSYHLRSAIDWLKRAQDATPDGGVSRGFGLAWNPKFRSDGWQPSYPETTGYIIPTMIRAADVFNEPDLLRRARLMADWEMAIMGADGSVPGGNITEEVAPAVFDAGQVIRGLWAVWQKTREPRYLAAARGAAEWMLNHEHQKEGRWVTMNARGVNEFTTTYNIYAAVPVALLGKEVGSEAFLALGKRVGDFTMRMQNERGWFEQCDFTARPDALLHTLGYAIDGLWDMGSLLDDTAMRQSAKRALDGVFGGVMDERGYIPGRLNGEWRGTVEWACLTGMAQVAVTAMKIYRTTKEERYRDAAFRVKEFLKTCQNGIDDTRGGLGAVWGSWPISGEYGQYEALSWAAKCLADLLMEMIVTSKDQKFKHLNISYVPSAAS